MSNDLNTGSSAAPVTLTTQQLRALGMYAVAAHFDPTTYRLIIDLQSGIKLSVPTGLIETLQEGKPDQLKEIEISPSGLGLFFPQLDADILISGLLRGIMGSPAWMSDQPERITRVKQHEDNLIAQARIKAQQKLRPQIQLKLKSRRTTNTWLPFKKGELVKVHIGAREPDESDDYKIAARRPGTPPKSKKKR